MSVFYTIFYILSTFFIIQLVPTFYGLPIVEQTRITVRVGLAAAILALILSVCVTQCIGINHVGQGMGTSSTNVPLFLKLTKRLDDILILSIFQGLMAIIYGKTNARKIFGYLYFLPTAITALYPPWTHPLSPPSTRKRKLKRRCKREKKASPLLIVFDTILGMLFSFSSKLLTLITFQVTVRTMQSFTKVHFKAEPSPSNDTHKILYP